MANVPVSSAVLTIRTAMENLQQEVNDLSNKLVPIDENGLGNDVGLSIVDGIVNQTFEQEDEP